MPELAWSVGDDFHVLAEPYHSVDRHSDWPSAEAQETPEIHHDHDFTIAIANKTTNAAEHVLTFSAHHQWNASHTPTRHGRRRPAIHVFAKRTKDVDSRHKGGHDVGCVALQRFWVLDGRVSNLVHELDLTAMQQMFAAGQTAACVLSSDTPTLPY